MRQQRRPKAPQRQLFEENPAPVQRPVPEELRGKLLQILTQWLLGFSEPMVPESGDE